MEQKSVIVADCHSNCCHYKHRPHIVLVHTCIMVLSLQWVKCLSQISGNEYYNNTYFLNLTSDSWTPGPTMNFRRMYPICNLVTQQSGEREIVIVGGQDPPT